MTHKSLPNLYTKLESYSDFHLYGLNPLNFIETAEEVIRHKEPSSVPVLFQYFKDDPNYYWIFERIKMLMEHYYAPNYAAIIIENIDILLFSAPEWGCTTLMDIFKTPDYLQKSKKNNLLTIVKRMEAKGALHKEFFQELIMLLNIEDAEERNTNHV